MFKLCGDGGKNAVHVLMIKSNLTQARAAVVDLKMFNYKQRGFDRCRSTAMGDLPDHTLTKIEFIADVALRPKKSV